MSFLKFEILTSKETQSHHQEKVEIVLNSDHIISIKPIKFFVNEEIVDGFWLRLSNGKKYKSTIIPKEISDAFAAPPVNPKKDITSEDNQNIYQ